MILHRLQGNFACNGCSSSFSTISLIQGKTRFTLYLTDLFLDKSGIKRGSDGDDERRDRTQEKGLVVDLRHVYRH